MPPVRDPFGLQAMGGEAQDQSGGTKFLTGGLKEFSPDIPIEKIGNFQEQVGVLDALPYQLETGKNFFQVGIDKTNPLEGVAIEKTGNYQEGVPVLDAAAFLESAKTNYLKGQIEDHSTRSDVPIEKLGPYKAEQGKMAPVDGPLKGRIEDGQNKQVPKPHEDDHSKAPPKDDRNKPGRKDEGNGEKEGPKKEKTDVCNAPTAPPLPKARDTRPKISKPPEKKTPEKKTAPHPEEKCDCERLKRVRDKLKKVLWFEGKLGTKAAAIWHSNSWGVPGQQLGHDFDNAAVPTEHFGDVDLDWASDLFSFTSDPDHFSTWYEFGKGLHDFTTQVRWTPMVIASLGKFKLWAPPGTDWAAPRHIPYADRKEVNLLYALEKRRVTSYKELIGDMSVLDRKIETECSKCAKHQHAAKK